MADVVFHPSASTDYRMGLAHYAQRSRRAARGFEREVERVLAAAAGQPLRYPECEAGCREAILTRYPYSVVYRVESDGSVLVVAVAHASREPGYWLGRV
jgi:plasmid stabilization system protein ParE